MQQWGRIALLAAMFVTAYLLILAWQKDYGAVAQVNQTTVAAAPNTSTSADIPAGVAVNTGPTDIPNTVVAKPTTAAASSTPQTSNLIEVVTDVYHLWIDPKGDDVVRAELLQHDLNKNQEDKPFVILENDANRVYIAQSGLVGINGVDASINGRPNYESENKQYRLTAGQKELVVPLVYKDPNGVEVIKSFTLKAGLGRVRCLARLSAIVVMTRVKVIRAFFRWELIWVVLGARLMSSTIS